MLEQYMLGEMAPDEAAALQRRLENDEELQGRLRALDASDDEIRRSHPPVVVAARVRQELEARASGARQPARRWSFALQWRAAALVVGILALMVLVAPPLLGPRDESSDRIKGLEPTLLLYRKTVEGSEPLQDHATARTGDLIRVGYRAAGQTWGVILSVDSRGVVTRHLPREGRAAARLSTDDQVLLDLAYELDDAPRWERFYLVAGAAPFDVAPVIDVARRAAASSRTAPPPVLPLGMSAKQSSLLLIKEATP
jgi:anti-sigma factor RsiW